MSTLADKVAIVTGASSGIGEATATAIARRGATVVVTARRADRLEGLASRITDAGGRAEAIACDVRDREQVLAMARQTTERLGRVDVLVNNAGVFPLGPLAKCRFDDWDRLIDVNVKGALYSIGAVLPTMVAQGTGHVINVGSVAGHVVFPNGTVYCATKHALHAISEGLRAEMSLAAQDDGNTIRVTTIAPGVVTTELTDSITDPETREQTQAYFSSMKGPLQPEDIASAVCFVLEAPAHMDVSEVLVRPTEQLR